MIWLVIEALILIAVAVILGIVIGVLARQMWGARKAAMQAEEASINRLKAGESPADAAAPAPIPEPMPATAPVVTDGESAPMSAPEPGPAPVAPSAEAAPEPGAAPAAPSAEAAPEPKAVPADDISGSRPATLAAPRGGKADDLKKIRGIGPQNEHKLNALGIYHYAQIAAWTPEEAHWVGTYLAFPGRIEREDWIGQARKFVTS